MDSLTFPDCLTCQSIQNLRRDGLLVKSSHPHCTRSLMALVSFRSGGTRACATHLLSCEAQPNRISEICEPCFFWAKKNLSHQHGVSKIHMLRMSSCKLFVLLVHLLTCNAPFYRVSAFVNRPKFKPHLRNQREPNKAFPVTRTKTTAQTITSK